MKMFVGVDPSQNNTSVAYSLGRSRKIETSNLTREGILLQDFLRGLVADGYEPVVMVERNHLRRGSWALSYNAACAAMREVVAARVKPKNREFTTTQAWHKTTGVPQVYVPEGAFSSHPEKKRRVLQYVKMVHNLDLDDDNQADAVGILMHLAGTRFGDWIEGGVR